MGSVWASCRTTLGMLRHLRSFFKLAKTPGKVPLTNAAAPLMPVNFAPDFDQERTVPEHNKDITYMV